MSASESRLMLVDDDEGIREALSEILQDEGYRVCSASDGAQALALLRAADDLPCLILLDLMMPEMDGYEFRRAQLRDPRLREIPTIVLTAGTLDDCVNDLGVADCLRKPIDLDRLLERVASLV